MPGTRLPRKIEFEVIMAKTGMTAAELSTESGIPIRTIHDLRTREFSQAPTPRTVHSMAEALRVSCAKLLRAIGVPVEARRAFLRDPANQQRKAVHA